MLLEWVSRVTFFYCIWFWRHVLHEVVEVVFSDLRALCLVIALNHFAAWHICSTFAIFALSISLFLWWLFKIHAYVSIMSLIKLGSFPLITNFLGLPFLYLWQPEVIERLQYQLLIVRCLCMLWISLALVKLHGLGNVMRWKVACELRKINS